jgi:site-specific recombinase XerD
MALRKRGGKWHFRFKLHGKEYAEATGLAATKQNERAAGDQESRFRSKLEQGKEPRRILLRRFNDAALQFLQWAEAEYREHPNSYRRIKTSFASLVEILGRDVMVSMIREAHLEDFKTQRVLKHKVRDVTVRHDLHALSKFFGYAIKQNWAHENPVRNVDIPSDRDAIRIHVLSAHEEKQYFTRAAKWPDLHDLGRLIINQGLRPEEVTSLPKADINLERGQLKIAKGKSAAARRTIYLTSESQQIIAQRMKGESVWLFPSPRIPGRPIARLNSAHDALCRQAGKDGLQVGFVIYDFRHTFATRMAIAGVDLATLAAILGHSRIAMVQKYVHPTAEHQRNGMLRYEEAAKLAQQHGEQQNEGIIN